MVEEPDARSSGGQAAFGGVMNAFDAVDVNAAWMPPPFDDKLIPEVLGYLGFDVMPATQRQRLPALASAAPDDDDDDDSNPDEMNAKKPHVWENQREVQKRYRERKKNHAKMLEAKVASLEAKLQEMKCLLEAKQESAVPGHLTIGSIVNGAGAGADDAHGESDSGGLVCPSERQTSRTTFGELADRMRLQLNHGAADADIRCTLHETLKAVRAEDASCVLDEHAEAINDERGRRPDKDIASEARGVGGEVNSPHGSGGAYGSTCGSPFRRVGLDGTVMNKEEAHSHCVKICDTFVSATPPAEVEMMVEWRDEYVERLCDIYHERQRLGLLLASSGGAVIVDHHQRGEPEPEPEPVTENVQGGDGGGGEVSMTIAAAPLGSPESPVERPGIPSDSSGCGSDETCIEAFTVDAKIVKPELHRGGLNFARRQGGRISSAIKVLDELKLSVQGELNVRKDMMCDLVNRRLQPRTAARLIVLSLPMFPDPLAVALELKHRGLGTRRPIVA